ncbi:hypothetical protein ABK040_014792 [Willaertia magna]
MPPRQQPQQAPPQNDTFKQISEAWDQFPTVTKYLGVFAFSLTLFSSFQLISVYNLYLDFGAIFNLKTLELWRLITNVFFFGGFGFPFLINFMIFIQYCNQLERDHFDGRVADFVYCFIVGLIPMTLAAYFLSLPFLSSSIIMFLVYIWCNLNPDAELTLMFVGLKIPSRWFPFALAALHVVLGDSILTDALGIVCGHIYYFLDVKYPSEYGSRILNTPSFLYWIFPPSNVRQVHGVHHNVQQQQAAQQQEQQHGRFFGRGRRLED